jgi:hypothetical protein
MEQVKAQEVEQPEKKTVDLIPEERLKELLNILMPYGYSHYDGNKYTGVSPYIGSTRNIITIVSNDPRWGGLFSICMEHFSEDENEENCLGFYKGIMKVIAPELHSDDEKFNDVMNVIDFNWAVDRVKDNSFSVKVTYEPF